MEDSQKAEAISDRAGKGGLVFGVCEAIAHGIGGRHMRPWADDGLCWARWDGQESHHLRQHRGRDGRDGLHIPTHPPDATQGRMGRQPITGVVIVSRGLGRLFLASTSGPKEYSSSWCRVRCGAQHTEDPEVPDA